MLKYLPVILKMQQYITIMMTRTAMTQAIMIGTTHSIPDSENE
jgi:hypothetical protein